MEILAKEFYHLLTNDGVALIFCSNLQIGKWYSYLSDAGFKLQPAPIYVINSPTSNYNWLYSGQKATRSGKSIQVRTQSIIVAHKQKTMNYNWQVILFILTYREIKNSFLVNIQEQEMLLKIMSLQDIHSKTKI